MSKSLSAAAVKTLTTISAGPVDCYARTAGIDCRTLKALVRKGLLVRVAGGDYRHAITEAGRAAIAPVAIPEPAAPAAASGIIYLPADYKPTYLDNSGRVQEPWFGMGN